MYAPISNAALLRRLDALGRPDLLAKVNDLRGRMSTYLRGVNVTFSHYTSHAVVATKSCASSPICCIETPTI